MNEFLIILAVGTFLYYVYRNINQTYAVNDAKFELYVKVEAALLLRNVISGSGMGELYTAIALHTLTIPQATLLSGLDIIAYVERIPDEVPIPLTMSFEAYSRIHQDIRQMQLKKYYIEFSRGIDTSSYGTPNHKEGVNARIDHYTRHLETYVREGGVL